MSLPIAGAIKAKTAKSMALFAKSIQKTDWDGVNNAMTKIKQFGESASVVQETMGDIKDLGDGLKTLALGDLMAKISTKAGELYTALEPYAIMLGNLTKNLDLSGLDKFITSLRALNLLIENSDRALNNLFGWLIPIINALLGTNFDTGGGGGGDGPFIPPHGFTAAEGF